MTHRTGDIRLHNGRPMVHVDGKPIAFAAYSPVSAKRAELFTAQVQRFATHRLDAYFITAPSTTDTEDFFAQPFWVGDQIASSPLTASSLSIADQAAVVENADPGASLIIRFGFYEPQSWRTLHPDDLFIDEEGRRHETPSLASTRWQEQVERFSAAMVHHCEHSIAAERIIGYWNGHRVEGTHEPLIKGMLFDHSPVMQTAWNDFLREQYATESALQKTYGHTAHFGTVPVPNDPLRGTTREVDQRTYVQAALDNQPLRDWLELTSRLYRRHTLGLARAMNAALAGRQRFLVYDAFKQTALGWNNLGFFDRNFAWPAAYPEIAAGSGSMGVATWLDEPGIDGLITPHDYQWRDVGGTYEPEGIADSCVLRGKIMLCEMDTRTADGTDPCAPAQNESEFAAVTWRNLATGWTRGFHSYWMDVYQDWFTERFHPTIAAQVRALRNSVAWKHQDVPGIAVVLDDACVMETDGRGNVLNELVMWELRHGLARCGVPVRIYLAEDLELATMPAHRLWYFPTSFRVSAERLATIRRVCCCADNVVLWGPLTGLSDGSTLDVRHAQEVTQFEFSYLGVNIPRRWQPTDFSHPIMEEAPTDAWIGSPLAFGPAIYPTDGVALGRAWGKSGTAWSGFAIKQCAGWTSAFTVAAPLPAWLWRGLARFAGCHIYETSGEVLMASTEVVALHSIRPGAKTLTIPRPSTVTDVIHGRIIGHHLSTISWTSTEPETRVFHLTPDAT